MTILVTLKGTVSRDILLQVFSWIIFSQVPETNIRVLFWKLATGTAGVVDRWQICHRCQQCQWQICRRCQQCQWQICRRCHWHRWKNSAGVNATDGKLPPVSMTLAGNLPVRCHRRQLMGTISDCWHLNHILHTWFWDSCFTENLL